GLVSYLIEQVRDTLFSSPLFERLADPFLKRGRHPDYPLYSTIAEKELLARDKVHSDAHKSRGLSTPSDRAGECRELHAYRRHSLMASVHNHNSVCFRDDSDYALEASAGGHRIVHYSVHVHGFNRTAGGLFDITIHTFKAPHFSIEDFFFPDGLVSPCRVDFFCRLAVKPVERAAKSESFRRHYANMTRCKRLAEKARIKIFH